MCRFQRFSNGKMAVPRLLDKAECLAHETEKMIYGLLESIED